MHSTAQNSRRSILSSPRLVADELIAQPHLPPKGVTVRRQLAITLRGAFEFQVGTTASWVDSSRLLFADANRDFADRHVSPHVGHHSIILTPGEELLDELWRDVGSEFTVPTRPCAIEVQRLAQALRRSSDALTSEELSVAILERCADVKVDRLSLDTRCVRRAKAMLIEGVEGRLTLGQIASELGVTPAYLTQAFKRSEGMPLYRYQTRLRLCRALERLPERESIADLAFELGFSSHSHFSAAFKAEVGIAPSAYRLASGSVGAPAHRKDFVGSGSEACPNR